MTKEGPYCQCTLDVFLHILYFKNAMSAIFSSLTEKKRYL